VIGGWSNRLRSFFCQRCCYPYFSRSGFASLLGEARSEVLYERQQNTMRADRRVARMISEKEVKIEPFEYDELYFSSLLSKLFHKQKTTNVIVLFVLEYGSQGAS
jgi:hypothetical protein